MCLLSDVSTEGHVPVDIGKIDIWPSLPCQIKAEGKFSGECMRIRKFTRFLLQTSDDL